MYSVFIIPTSFSRLLKTYNYSAFQSFLTWYYDFCCLLTVRCYYTSFRIRLLLRTYETSSGKRNHLHLIYRTFVESFCILHLEIWAVLNFVLVAKLVRFKMFYIQFLLDRPRLCRGLPSDSASRRTPLLLTNNSYWQACSGLSPPSNCACRTHQQKSLLPHGKRSFNNL